jgi:colanic acid biosynthesis glycosyl transferase WcaI
MRLSKVFPSLSCGVPVIYAGVGEAAELLEANKCGIGVEPENPALLSQAISSLASDQTKRDQMGCAGRALVEREYSWTSIVKHWLDEIRVSDAAVNGHR